MVSPGVEIIESTEYFGYVYMWCDIERNKYYIGSHKGSVYDSYISGSRWVNNIVRKRSHTMKMRVLEYYFGKDREELYKLEEKWLKFYGVSKNKNYYNFHEWTSNGQMGRVFKHKGRKRTDYSPGWVDHRKGKKAEEIYRDPVKFKANLSRLNKEYYEKHGHGKRKGVKTSGIDPRKGKTVEEIYGYRRVVNPNKPFVVTISEPFENPYDIYCRHETDFYELVKMESNNLGYLKRERKKEVLRRLPSTKHNFPIGTILTLNFVEQDY